MAGEQSEFRCVTEALIKQPRIPLYLSATMEAVKRKWEFTMDRREAGFVRQRMEAC